MTDRSPPPSFRDCLDQASSAAPLAARTSPTNAGGGALASVETPPPPLWPRNVQPASAQQAIDSNPLGFNGRDLRSGSSLIAPGRPNPFVYEVWPQVGGRNRFLCNGRCVTGPPIDFWYNCCAWSFILVPCIFYFTVCAKFLWYEVSASLVILTAGVMLSSMAFMLLTSCTDPGIIPRHALQLAVVGLEAEVAEITCCPPLAFDTATSEPVVTLTEEQSALGYRWCPSCKVIRPPRSSHCRDCDNCVMRFDHHCPFVNNCVGQRNYAYFSAFLASTGCLGFAVAAGIAIYFSHVADQSHHNTPLHGPWLIVLLVAIGVPTAGLLIGVVCLLLFHGVLACRGRTTKEVLTGKLNVGGHTLCSLRGPSLIHARSRVSFPMTVV